MHRPGARFFRFPFRLDEYFTEPRRSGLSVATAYIAVNYQWSRALDLAALITVCSGLLFSFMNAGRTIEEEEPVQ